MRLFLQSELFPLKFSISSQPGWQAGTINVALLQTRKVLENTALFHRSPVVDNIFDSGGVAGSSPDTQIVSMTASSQSRLLLSGLISDSSLVLFLF